MKTSSKQNHLDPRQDPEQAADFDREWREDKRGVDSTGGYGHGCEVGGIGSPLDGPADFLRRPDEIIGLDERGRLGSEKPLQSRPAHESETLKNSSMLTGKVK